MTLVLSNLHDENYRKAFRELWDRFIAPFLRQLFAKTTKQWERVGDFRSLETKSIDWRKFCTLV